MCWGGERLHVDDTPVPVLAKGGAAQGPRQAKLGGVGSGGKTKTGRLWTAVRDDRPYGGADPPAAFYVYSPDRAGAHPEAFLRTWSGIMQADAYAGFNKLYERGRLPGTILEAGCWAHWRRKFYEIAALKKAPIAVEAVTRIDAIFAIERTINGITFICASSRARANDQVARRRSCCLDERAAAHPIVEVRDRQGSGLWPRCLVPGSRDAKLSRKAEEALWQAFFMAAPAQRREFEPNSKRRKRRRVSSPGATV